ncbi:uncharacterized protein [Venturia canescens]|uniref:uncharacterized protein n=1 Tax=Venturia canescens TaxID=32260 RepID=UPI001C9BEABA|nr:uncharacterized protein LOC122405842 [Venturia canescens]
MPRQKVKNATAKKSSEKKTAGNYSDAPDRRVTRASANSTSRVTRSHKFFPEETSKKLKREQNVKPATKSNTRNKHTPQSLDVETSVKSSDGQQNNCVVKIDILKKHEKNPVKELVVASGEEMNNNENVHISEEETPPQSLDVGTPVKSSNSQHNDYVGKIDVLKKHEETPTQSLDVKTFVKSSDSQQNDYVGEIDVLKKHEEIPPQSLDVETLVKSSDSQQNDHIKQIEVLEKHEENPVKELVVVLGEEMNNNENTHISEEETPPQSLDVGTPVKSSNSQQNDYVGGIDVLKKHEEILPQSLDVETLVKSSDSQQNDHVKQIEVLEKHEENPVKELVVALGEEMNNNENVHISEEKNLDSNSLVIQREPENNTSKRLSLNEIAISFDDSEFETGNIVPIELQNISDVMNNLDDPELNMSNEVDEMVQKKWDDCENSENFEGIDPFRIHQMDPSCFYESNIDVIGNYETVDSSHLTNENDEENHPGINSTSENPNETYVLKHQQDFPSPSELEAATAENIQKEDNSQLDEDDDESHNKTANFTNEDPNDDTFDMSNHEEDVTNNTDQLSQSNTEGEIAESDISTLRNASHDLNAVKTVGAIDDKAQFVEAGALKTKSNFCLYCKKMQTVISRHLEKVHDDKSPVKRFSKMNKGSDERKQIIEALRLQGNYIFNTDKRYNTTGKLLVSRRPKTKREAAEYRTCHNCKGCFSKKTIRRHFKICVGTSSKHKRSNIVLSRRIEGRIHNDASKRLVAVFSILREDDVIRLVRYDDLLIRFGNCMCEKYRKQQQESMIRNRLRTLGRLLQVMKENNPAVTDFKSIYHPKLYRTMLQAVKMMAGYDEETGEVKTPSIVVSIGIYIKAVGELLKLWTIENDDDEHQKLVEKYLFLHKSQYSISANRVALEEQARKHREQTKPLPTTEDIKKLSDYVVENRRTAYKKLTEKYSYDEWLRLQQYTLISIQIFNRRRAGEIERAMVSDLKQLEKINETTKPDVYRKLTEEQKKMVSLYSRFIIVGKLGRDVPVLLDKEMENALVLVLQHRQAARVPAKNPFVFGIPGFEDGRLKYSRACNLMRQFAQECGAENPERLRGTSLRKHMATTCAAENVDENDIMDIANFMGHAEAIHSSHYRQSVVSRDVVGVAKFLRSAMGHNEPEIIDTETTSRPPDSPADCTNEAIVREEQSSDFNDRQTSTPIQQRQKKTQSRKRRLTVQFDTSESESSNVSESPPRKSRKKSTQKKQKNSNTVTNEKKTKKRWSQREKDLALRAFGTTIKNNKLPSTHEIKSFLLKNKEVIRTVDQVRAWASNEKKKWNQDFTD